MSTEKLFWQDSYLRNFSANVLETKKNGDLFEVKFDKTAFYPTSGGQLHDTGRISTKKVVEVFERDGEILHCLEGTVEAGQAVQCEIDWPRRFDFMQQHTAFHLLAQSFLRIAGADTLSSHLGEQDSTIDVALTKVDEETVARVEDLANQIVYENRRIRSFQVGYDETSSLDLRKVPAKTDQIRLVEIEDFDLDPCGGTHVASTGEVGCIKLLAAERIRGNQRFRFLAGRRALADYRTKTKLLQGLSAELTTGIEDISESVRKLRTDLRLSEKRSGILADEFVGVLRESLLNEHRRAGGKVVSRIVNNVAWDKVRKLGFSPQANGIESIILAQTEPSVRLLAATTRSNIDLRNLVPQVQNILDGRGGGKPSFVEVAGTNGARMQEAIAAAMQFLSAE